MLKKLFFSAIICLGFIPVFSQSAQQYVPCNAMPLIMQNYHADIMALDRVYIVIGSPEKRERYKSVANDYLSRLKKIDFDQLPQECKADYILFKRDLNNTVREYNEEAADYNKLRGWFPFADSIYHLEKVRRRGAIVDGKAVAGNFNTIIDMLPALREKLLAARDFDVSDERAASMFISGMLRALDNVYRFYNGYDPGFTWWVPVTYTRLDSALRQYRSLFHTVATRNAPKKDSSGIVGFPIGRQEIIAQLQNEMIPYTPEELIDIANKEFAWCDKEMLKASNEMGFGNDWKKALEKVKNSYVPVGTQATEMVDLYHQSIDFIRQKDLISIPPLAEETWRIVMMTPRQQLVNPFFYGGEEFAVSYPTNTMDYDAKMMSMRGNNPHFSRATVHHELIPGHYLQQFMNDRVYTYRHFDTPFWTEGWSLYWEMLLWNEKFPRGPEDRVGMLFWRMHRCARIIFSLNYHLGKWSPQECIDFLVDRVGHERANAEGEVRRSFVGGYSPLYQVAYLIGGLQIMSLKNEIVSSGKMSIKQFHDAFLQQNNMPIEMVRAILEKKPLSADFKTSWKFYVPTGK